MATSGIALPGDTLAFDSLPGHLLPGNNKQPKLGPGLQLISPSTFKATACGVIQGDGKRRSIFVESNGGRVRDFAVLSCHH